MDSTKEKRVEIIKFCVLYQFVDLADGAFVTD